MTPPAAAAAPAVQPRRPIGPRGPRRVSGPARPARPRVARPSRARPTEQQGGLVLGLIGAAQGLAQHRLLDRLIRGRTWIGLVAFALIGIVTLQLGLLKLNGGIGRALEHEALLQRENATLSIENSELAAGTRVESQAARLGMAFVPSGALRFLTARSSSDAAKAAGALSGASHSAAVGGGESSATASGESPSGEQAHGGTSSTSGESSTGESSSSAAGESHASTSESEQPTSEARESNAAGSEATAATGAAPASSEASSESSSGATREAASSEAAPGGGAQGGTPASGTGE